MRKIVVTTAVTAGRMEPPDAGPDWEALGLAKTPGGEQVLVWCREETRSEAYAHGEVGDGWPDRAVEEYVIHRAPLWMIDRLEALRKEGRAVRFFWGSRLPQGAPI